MKVEQRKLSDIKPYPHNPRINDQAVDPGIRVQATNRRG